MGEQKMVPREPTDNEIDAVAFHLCEADGADPHQLIWEGNPPEPWGEVWQRYTEPARAICRTMISAAPPVPAADAELITTVIRDVAELDNPSHPDWPEALVVTPDDLRNILERNLQTAADALAAENARLRKCVEAADGQLSRVLHEMAGAVSVCWEPRPTGVFETTQALEFVAAAIAELRAALKEPSGG